MLFKSAGLVAIIGEASPPKPSAGIDLSYWKWVVIIGVAAMIVFYVVKRVSDIVVKKKTDTMIRNVVGEDSGTGENEDEDED